MPSAIRLLVLDVDGVLTDGRLYFGVRGEALKAFHVRDGVSVCATCCRVSATSWPRSRVSVRG